MVNADHVLSCQKQVLSNQIEHLHNIDPAKSRDLYVCSRAARKVLAMDSSALVIDYILSAVQFFGCRLTHGLPFKLHTAFSTLVISVTALHKLHRCEFISLSDRMTFEHQFAVGCNWRPGDSLDHLLYDSVENQVFNLDDFAFDELPRLCAVSNQGPHEPMIRVKTNLIIKKGRYRILDMTQRPNIVLNEVLLDLAVKVKSICVNISSTHYLTLRPSGLQNHWYFLNKMFYLYSTISFLSSFCYGRYVFNDHTVSCVTYEHLQTWFSRNPDICLGFTIFIV